MTCLNCSAELLTRNRLKSDMSGLAYKYYHCPICNKDFDVDSYEIVHKDDKYILKKDTL